MLHLIQMMVIGYFLCLFACSFWQQDKDREGEESQFWRKLCSFLLAFLHSSEQARCCPTVVVSPLPAGLRFRELQNTTLACWLCVTKGHTTSSQAPSSWSHLGVFFRRVRLKSWYVVKLQHAISAISWAVCNSINGGVTQSTSLRGFMQGRRKKVPIRYLQKIL